VLLALVVGAWLADRGGREQMAGALLGFAGALKLTPLLLLGYFAVRGRWRAVAAGVLAFGAANGLTLLALGPAVFRDYAAVLTRVAQHRSGRTNAALPGLFAKLFNPAPDRPLTPLWRSAELDRLGTLAAVAVVVAIAAVAIRPGRSGAARDRGFGLAVVTLLLVGPLTWEHTLLLLMLPLAILARDWSVWNRTRRTLFLIAVAAVWLMPYTIRIAFGLYEDVPANPITTLTAFSYQCYALVILFALFHPAGTVLS
jgi:hypothetical protein